MANTIVIYGSRYGTAKRYAEQMASRLHTVAISYKDVGNINTYDTIIYIGALYAGGVLGMSKTFKALSAIGHKQMILITVGLADPTDPENVCHIRTGIQQQINKDLLAKLRIYHLRGAVNYHRLGMVHRIMMWMVFNKARKTPQEQMTPEVRMMLDTYNKEVDFIDLASLEPILSQIER